METAENTRADDLLEEVHDLQIQARAIRDEARRTGNGDLALRAIARLERQAELIAKVLGLIDTRGPVNVNVANVTGGTYPVLEDVARFETLLKELAIKKYPPTVKEVPVIRVTAGTGPPPDTDLLEERNGL